jgi:multidrug efflux pump subunit AcrB
MKKKSDIPIIIIFISLVLFGIISFFYLDFNIIPEIEFPELILITTYPNSSPDEIDTMVTKPLEEMISSLKGVKNVSSVSREGISIIRIQYDWKSDLTEAHIELRDKVDQVAPFFPREVQRPIIMNYQPAMDAIAGIIVKSSLNPDDLYLLTNKDIKPVFERIEGISYVKLQGGTKPEIKIILKPEILNKYNIGINEIKEKIQNSNKDFPVGFYEENNREYQLRVKGRFDNYQDFGKIIIKNDKEKVVTLSDCAEIEYGSEIKRSGVLVDGNEQIVIMLYKQPGENVIQLSKRIKKRIKYFK